MTQTYNIKNGEISFDDEKIVIKDDAKKQFRLRLFSSIMWTFYGLFSVLRSMKTGDQFLLWTGLLIGIAHFVILMFTLFRSTKSEVRKSEILSLELKERMGNKFLDIKLAGNKIRRVSQIDSIYDELEAYIEVNFRNE